jgi:hypothetical protein
MEWWIILIAVIVVLVVVVLITLFISLPKKQNRPNRPPEEPEETEPEIPSTVYRLTVIDVDVAPPHPDVCVARMEMPEGVFDVTMTPHGDGFLRVPVNSSINVREVVRVIRVRDWDGFFIDHRAQGGTIGSGVGGDYRLTNFINYLHNGRRYRATASQGVCKAAGF